MLDGKRILLVEDEFLVADMAEGLLQDMGAEVIGPAYNLQEGLALAAREAIHGAVLDVNLNGERSDPIGNVLQERGVPFMYVTGYGAAGVAHADVPVLDKPYDSHRLRATLTQMLGGAEGAGRAG